MNEYTPLLIGAVVGGVVALGTMIYTKRKGARSPQQPNLPFPPQNPPSTRRAG